MEQTTDYCYNCDATKSLQLSSSYPNALLSISLLVSNNIDSSSELEVHNCFENANSEVVLDMDMIENEVALSNALPPKSSMDMAFSVKNKEGVSRIVLSELKLNVDNVFNVKMADIDKKCTSTMGYFSENQIFENVFVIFADNRVEVAKSNFSRWRIAHNYNPNRKAITMIELQKMFFLYRV